MLSAHIQQELLRRLSPKRVRTLAKSVGLDPDHPLPEIAGPLPHGLDFTGSVDFDVTIGAFGHLTTTPCRVSFTASLMDGRDSDAGKPLRIVGESREMLHMLIPTAELNPAFEWFSISHRLLPAAAAAQLDDQVEVLARLMELSRPSSS
jgi:hypothetical protein